ncbi:hypothetical protein GCM10010520_18600 [Rhizobium viscosum]|uniref:Uncharacterized protein n=1 Tax=Rhizobium viscosum TaxID=1673 RepID=A0ABR9IWM0_RHIVS|nr:hypothetical protein [Rhizobium viscosum]MBE1507604.1 hypothetical protein [Rhizobium viscosum]
MLQHLQNSVGAVLCGVAVGAPEVDPGLTVLDVEPGAALSRLRTPIIISALLVLA